MPDQEKIIMSHCPWGMPGQQLCTGACQLATQSPSNRANTAGHGLENNALSRWSSEASMAY
jgi:hypothetical protein